MFDHVGFGVSNYAASKDFFLQALEPLGVGIVMEGEHGLGIGPKGKPALWLFESPDKPVPMHLAFTATNRQQVQAFHRAALAAGGKDNATGRSTVIGLPTSERTSVLGSISQDRAITRRCNSNRAPRGSQTSRPRILPVRHL